MLLPQITATDKFIQRVTKGGVTLLDIAGIHGTAPIRSARRVSMCTGAS